MENTSKKSSPRLQLIISVMIMAALFIAELYVMINESKNVVLVVGIAVLILIALYSSSLLTHFSLGTSSFTTPVLLLSLYPAADIFKS